MLGLHKTMHTTGGMLALTLEIGVELTMFKYFRNLFSALLLALIASSVSSCSSSSHSTSSENKLHTAETFEEAIKMHSNSIVETSSGSITKASPPEKTTESPTYIIYYTVTDPAMLTKSINPNDSVAYERNLAITNQWSEKFCSTQLKSVMEKFSVLMVSGLLVTPSGQKHSLSACVAD